MNLQKLFKMQAELDAVIVEKQNLKEIPLNNLILALIVELGEMANEWQGFKHWKVDKTARTSLEVACSNCARDWNTYRYSKLYGCRMLAMWGRRHIYKKSTS